MRIGNTSVRVLTIAVSLGTISLGAIVQADVSAPYLLKDTLAGSSSGFIYSSVPVVSGNALFIRSANNTLWRTNGRSAGTVQIDTGVSVSPVVVSTGGVAYLRSNTTGGTSLHFVNATGTSTQIMQPVSTIPSPRGSVAAIAVGSRVIFTTGGSRYMSWDSATGVMEDLGTTFLPTTSADIMVVGSRAFALSTSSPATLNVTDGTAAGTGTIGQFSALPYMISGMSASYLQNGGDGVCFVVRETTTNQLKMCGSDGTAAGTRVLGSMPTFSGTLSTWSSQGSLGIYAAVVVPSGSTSRAQLWHFGTTTDDTGLLLDFPSNTRFINLGSANGINVFADTGQGTYTGPSSTARMWITNGTPGQTFIGPFVSVNQDTQTAVPIGMTGSTAGVANGDEVYFFGANAATGVEPWHFNTVTGTMGLLGELAPDAPSPALARMFPLGFSRGVGVTSMSNPGAPAGAGGPGIVFFRGNVPQRYVPTVGLSSSIVPVALGNRVVFAATVSGIGTEPYAIDLCPADHDNSGTLDSGDVFGYLNDWLANDGNADFDRSGGSPAISDLFAFLNGWISGCP